MKIAIPLVGLLVSVPTLDFVRYVAANSAKPYIAEDTVKFTSGKNFSSITNIVSDHLQPLTSHFHNQTVG